MGRFVRIKEAATRLGVSPETLRKRIHGDYAEIFGVRLRAYRMDLGSSAERRFDNDELERALKQVGRNRS